MPSYVVISPVKDEERYIRTTLDSMVTQTVRPRKWLIVDDGSDDGTAEIVAQYCQQHSWMSLVRMPKRAKRLLGSAEVAAFQAGYELVSKDSFDLIVKLDGDLRIPPSYFEQLLARFESDPRLGIASGVYVEQHDGKWTAVRMPAYHAAGACKVVRADCFEQISGFVLSPGWDTVDEIRAQTLGWRTRHFPDLPFEHLRPEGTACGSHRTNRLHGEVSYMTGMPLLFFLLKAAHRMILGKPPVIAGLMLVAGYCKPLLLGRPRLVTKLEARHYARAQRRHLWYAFAGSRFGLGPQEGGDGSDVRHMRSL